MSIRLCRKIYVTSKDTMQSTLMSVDNKIDKVGKYQTVSVFSGFIFISCVVYCLIWIELHKMT